MKVGTRKLAQQCVSLIGKLLYVLRVVWSHQLIIYLNAKLINSKSYLIIRCKLQYTVWWSPCWESWYSRDLALVFWWTKDARWPSGHLTFSAPKKHHNATDGPINHLLHMGPLRWDQPEAKWNRTKNSKLNKANYTGRFATKTKNGEFEME